MLKLRQGIEIYVSLSVIDMRKSIDSLSALVLQEFQQDPQCGHLFIFFNRCRDKVKVLFWDRNGYVLHLSGWKNVDLLSRVLILEIKL